MNKSINKTSAQAGFTLIELIVVIVILGILAATALPRFTSLAGDARVASLQAARGAMSSAAAMAHGKYLINAGGPLPSVTIEGILVAFPTTAPLTGYPQATANFALASGLNAGDYTVIGPGVTATTTAPGTAANEIAIVPASIAGTTSAVACNVRYTEAAANAAPTFSAMPTATQCN